MQPLHQDPTLVGPLRQQRSGLTSLRENSHLPASVPQGRMKLPRTTPIRATLFGCFSSNSPQNRHPERSASQIYRVTLGLVARDKSARRFAQDDGFVEGLKKIWPIWPRQKKHKKIEKVTSSQDDVFVASRRSKQSASSWISVVCQTS